MSKKSAKTKTGGKPNISKLIGSILGAEDEKSIDFGKAYSKYTVMSNIIDRYVKLVKYISGTDFIRSDEDHSLAIDAYLETVLGEYNKFRAVDSNVLPEAHKKFGLTDNTHAEKTAIDGFIKVYNETKKIEIVSELLSLCDKMIPHRNCFQDMKNISDYFIINTPMTISFKPILRLDVDFKEVYMKLNYDQHGEEKRIVLLIMHKLYVISYDMYIAYGKPDINLEKFISIVTGSIVELRKKIPRCNDAFNLIINSTKLLEVNYDSYYKDYISSNNYSVIAERFIRDVADSLDDSAIRLTSQFKRIMISLAQAGKKSGNVPSQKYVEAATAGSEDVTSKLFKNVRKISEDGELVDAETPTPLPPKPSIGDLIDDSMFDDKDEDGNLIDDVNPNNIEMKGVHKLVKSLLVGGGGDDNDDGSDDDDESTYSECSECSEEEYDSENINNKVVVSNVEDESSDEDDDDELVVPTTDDDEKNKVSMAATLLVTSDNLSDDDDVEVINN